VIVAAEAAHEIGQGAGDQEVLLGEAQPLSQLCGVVRIEDAGQGLRGDAAGQGAHEVARAEVLEVEIVLRCRAPQPQAVDRAARSPPPAGHRECRSASTDDWDDPHVAPMHLEGAAERDLHGLAAARDFPGVLPRSQLSGCSRCQPFSIDCRNMPYS